MLRPRLETLIVLGLFGGGCGGSEAIPSGDALVGAQQVQTASSTTTKQASLPSLPVFMKATPGATCALHPGDSQDASQRLQLLADDAGIVRFYYAGSAAELPAAEYVLDCDTTQGSVSTQLVDDRSVLPASAVPKVAGRVRPALTGNPMALSRGELLQRGYAARPDPTADPDAYKTWLAMASQEVIIVPSVAKAAPQGPIARSFAPQLNDKVGDVLNSSWSGYQLVQPNARYSEVQGMITSVPDVIAHGFGVSNGQELSSFWVGLDGGFGGGSVDIVQAGIYMNLTVATPPVSKFIILFASYTAWAEWYPDNPKSNANFPSRPGDQILVDVSVGDSSRNININGGYEWFHFHNFTAAAVWDGCIGPPGSGCFMETTKGQQFVGDSAEWIIERPNVGTAQNPIFRAFPKYLTAQMSPARAWPWPITPSVNPITYASKRYFMPSITPPTIMSDTNLNGATATSPLINWVWGSYQ